METTFIYTLSCPIVKEVRYVGKSNKPRQRLYSHMNLKHTATTHKKNWIAFLINKMKKPLLNIVAEVPISNWKYWERYYIKYYIWLGFDLINNTNGGDGLTMGNKTSFKKGNKPWSAGKGAKKACAICNKEFKIRPGDYEKYKCCSMSCSSVYRRSHPNKGTFYKGDSPWNKGKKYHTKGIDVVQIDKNTGVVLNTFISLKQAGLLLNINPASISNVICGRGKTAGGFKWERRY